MSATALLVMDVQNNIVARFPEPGYLPRLRAAIDAARTRRVPIIYVVVGFRPGFPEVNPRNKMFGAVKERGVSGDPGQLEVAPEVAPADDDLVVTKHRVSAFSGSDLEMILRAQGITHLVLTGIATSGVVLSTLRQASDLDYELTVLSDACLDNDEEVHRVLVEKVFPRQASVITVAEWAPA